VRINAIAGLIFLVGCGSGGGDEGEAEGEGACGPATEDGVSSSPAPLPISASRDIDLLFVIDNSQAMETSQARLIAQFDTLLQTLGETEGGFPNAHVGVVSTDMGAGPYASRCAPIGGDSGRLLHRAPVGTTCSPPGDAFIQIDNANNILSGNIANVDTPNPGGAPGCQGLLSGSTPVPGMLNGEPDTAIDLCDIRAAFKCIADLGTDGCGFEQPLEAARRALTCVDEETCTNPGFVRGDDALLAVVFLGDEDDCSARDGTVFDPLQTTVESELGAFNSYRCFEYGVTCDPVIDRTGNQTLSNCRSKTVEDVGGDLDDLKLFPIQEYYDFFSTRKLRGRLVMAAISGPYAPGDTVSTTLNASLEPDVEPSCTGPGTATGFPAIRIQELVRRFGDNGVILADENAGSGICTTEFAPALTRVGDIVRSRLARSCVASPLIQETKGATALIDDPSQASCCVFHVQDVRTADERSQEVPRCEFAADARTDCPPVGESPGALAPDATTPCWYVCDAGADCAYRWELRFCRDASCESATLAPAPTGTYGTCLTCNPADLGCLCGDGICDDSVGETAGNCAGDCR